MRVKYGTMPHSVKLISKVFFRCCSSKHSRQLGVTMSKALSYLVELDLLPIGLQLYSFTACKGRATRLELAYVCPLLCAYC
jgi:hypothetical protein